MQDLILLALIGVIIFLFTSCIRDFFKVKSLRKSCKNELERILFEMQYVYDSGKKLSCDEAFKVKGLIEEFSNNTHLASCYELHSIMLLIKFMFRHTAQERDDA